MVPPSARAPFLTSKRRRVREFVRSHWASLGCLVLVILIGWELFFVNKWTNIFDHSQTREQDSNPSTNNKIEENVARLNCTSKPYPKSSPKSLSSTVELDDELKGSFPKNNAFFLETLGNGALNIRQACSVESLAMHNPNLTVYVLFTGGKINSSTDAMHSLKEKYENIRLVGINMDDFLAGTAVEHWYHCTEWKKGPYHVSHLSDALRFLTLSKYGGYYFDLDFVFTRSVTNYRSFSATEDGDTMSVGAIHAEHGNPIVQLAVKYFALNYNPRLWGHNGPDFLKRILQVWCGVKDVQWMDYFHCKGFNILPPPSFYPVHWKDWRELFVQRMPNKVDNKPNWLTGEVVGIHTWNNFSYKEPIYKNSTQYYTQLIRAHCPKIFSIAPDVF